MVNLTADQTGHLITALAIYHHAGAVKAIRFMKKHMNISISDAVDILEAWDIAEESIKEAIAKGPNNDDASA